MNDLIKRSDAIDELMHIIPYRRYHNGEYVLLLDKRKCLAAIKAIPPADIPSAVDLSNVYSTAYKSGYEKGKADRPQEWTPCSERLPAKAGYYLCSFKKPKRVDHIYVDLAYWTDIRWAGYFINEINAWMPLPEPWKGADDD